MLELIVGAVFGAVAAATALCWLFSGRGAIDAGQPVVNSSRKFGSAQLYFRGDVRTARGDVLPALFTSDQLRDAIDRAATNPEDVE